MSIANIFKMILIVMSLSSVAFAQKSASELFIYSEGMLDGLNGGEGWGGAWEIFEGDPSTFHVKAGSLDYSDFTSAGNYLEGAITTASVRARRILQEMWIDEGQCWISFLMDIHNPAAADFTWQGLSLYSSVYELCLFGKGYGHPFISILNHAGGDVEYFSTTTWNQAALSWYVIRIDMSGNEQKEKCYMWRNPSPDNEPAVSDTLVSGEVNLNNGFDTVVIHFGHDAELVVSFDDIRLGATFAEVSPSSSPVAYKKINHSKGLMLQQNYPNPFNPVTTIGFSLETSSNISLKIFNLAGELTEILAEGYHSPGHYYTQWNAADYPSGIYFYELHADNYSEKRKLVLQK